MVSTPIGRGSRISAAAYTGRAVAPGALVESDPETKAVITRNSLQLGILSNQMQNLSAQMQSLTGSLQVIGTNLRAQNELEEAKDQQEAELQNRLAQQKLREGKESAIEKKIEAAAIAPAQRIAAKAQFTLSRLSGFFATIAGGWLLQKGVETIVAYKEGNMDKLNEIKNNILKNLLVAGAVFAAFKLAVPALIGVFGGIGLKLAAVATAAIFSGPILQFLGFLTDQAKGILNKITGGLLFNDEPDPETPDDGPKFEIYNPNQPEAAGGMSLSSDGKFFTKTELLQKKAAEGAPQVKPLSIALNPVTEESEDTYSSVQIEPQSTTVNMATVLDRPESKEEDSPIDPNVKAEYGETTLSTVDIGNGEQDLSKPMGSELNPNKKVIDPETSEYIRQEQYIGKYGSLPPSMLESMSRSRNVAQNVSQPVAEPGVTVVPMEQPSTSAPSSEPLVSGGINAPPFFTTSDPENIYTLGARSNFNVVSV